MLSRHATHPRQTLISAFVGWKAILLAVALGSAVAPSYDTSTTLFLQRNESDVSLVTRLTRWDAIYFTQSAKQGGYTFEQDWAFNAGLPIVVSYLVKAARSFGLEGANGSLEAAFGIIVAHVAHLLAVITLHDLTLRLFDRKPLAFLAGLLHVLSPAGLFLSAPYAESSFAFLAFAGYRLLASTDAPRGSLPWTAAQISAGAVFGLATAFRSNGLLNGLPFAAECLVVLHSLQASPITSANLKNAVAQLLGPIIGGILVAMGSIVPQYVAWSRYCSGASEPRVWCGRTVPSIYSFVQEHYWGVGFLRYWTPGNIPLFVLATPVLGLLLVSGMEVFQRPSVLERSPTAEKGGKSRMTSREVAVRSMALSQVLLAGLAITTYHVQIITRIASGYAVWYWWVAGCLLDEQRKGLGSKVLTFSIMYALIQGALFASFLPPA
ncbi:GPI mannosyltransferase 2 [Colletotrichum orbiculare MAFF 240422]|uniref:GPI mannosyltransferase 2 n=1 Tax=Colletotrichum orbiculare (strain 104-T / ATCC 96160 / CBS 514.97 / LARS 414 / MAFF 240422) TaxID=1213857 RepID=N4VME5_COLOR|nr:GPI mannosyltransferase 2 [Colletotrichum orbiculare MAFF 240422]